MTAQATISQSSTDRPGASFESPASVQIISKWFGSWNIQLRRQCHSPQTLAETYDALSDKWDQTLTKLGAQDAYLAVLFHALPLDLMDNKSAMPKVLDCGTGTGAFLSAFADLASGIPELHGVDVSGGMLERAQTALTERGLQVRLQKSELTCLPYPDGYFDVLLAAHVIEHIPDPMAALAEMKRVLKPGGLIVMCITRKSARGRAIQMRWRTHAVDEVVVSDWLRNAGLESAEHDQCLDEHLFDRMSIAVSARKPKFHLRLVTPATREDTDV